MEALHKLLNLNKDNGQEGGAKRKKKMSKEKKTSKGKKSSPKKVAKKSPRTACPKKTKKVKYTVKYIIGKNGMIYQMKRKKLGGMSSMPMDITNPNDDMFLLNKDGFNMALKKDGYDNNYSQAIKNGEYNYNMIGSPNEYSNPAKYGDKFKMEEPKLDEVKMEGGKKKKKGTKKNGGSCGCSKRMNSPYTYGGGYHNLGVDCPKVGDGSTAGLLFPKEELYANKFCNTAKYAYTPSGERQVGTFTLGGAKKRRIVKKKNPKKTAKKPVSNKKIMMALYKKKLDKLTVEQLTKKAKNHGIKITKKKDGKTVQVKKSTLVKKLCEVMMKMKK